jgi:hypothetical protein
MSTGRYLPSSMGLQNGLNFRLAIDDSVYGAYYFGREPGEPVQNFVLLDSTRGITDAGAQQRIREWLVDVQKNRNSQSL